jgi:hypothetical protein
MSENEILMLEHHLLSFYLRRYTRQILNGNLPGLLYQTDNIIYGVIGLGSFPQLTSAKMWEDKLFDLFSLITPPYVEFCPTVIGITMQVMNLTLIAATEGLNEEFHRQSACS